MKDVMVTVTEVISVPDDAEIHVAPSGAAIAVRLADGRMLRPWVVYELRHGDAEEHRDRDLKRDELEALGVEPADDTTAHLEEAE